MRVVILLAALFCAVLSRSIIAPGSFRPQEDISACREASIFATGAINDKSDAKMSIDKIVLESCETQIVAGKNFRFNMRFDGVLNSLIKVTVFKALDGTMKLSNVVKVDSPVANPSQPPSSSTPLMGGWLSVKDVKECAHASMYAVRKYNSANFFNGIAGFKVESCQLQVVNGLKYKMSIVPTGKKAIEFIVLETNGSENNESQYKVLQPVLEEEEDEEDN